MTIWGTIIDWIKRLFGVDPIMTREQYQANSQFATLYGETREVNFTAIFAGKIATFVASESVVTVTAPTKDGPITKRIELLDSVLQNFWTKSRKYVAQLLGIGGIAIVPYVADGQIYFDVVSQDRISINQKRGDHIIAATILADMITRNGKRYYRWADYQLVGSSHILSNKATSEGGPIPMDSIPEWAGIQDEISITGVDSLLFAFIKSPVDNRQTHDLYGVPITYGCGKIIAETQELLKQIEQEYKLKKSFIGLDSRLVDKETNKLKTDGLFAYLTGTDKDSFWTVFDPAIRDTAYYARLDRLFELLEKQVGVSRGILTEPTSRGATATEIKAGLYDTYSMVESVRDVLERGISDFMYACDVLANAYSLSPTGEYDIRFDWSYALIESSQETFAQYVTGESIGAIETAEVRNYLQSEETLEESRQRVEEIKAQNKKMANDLLNASLTDDAQGAND